LIACFIAIKKINHSTAIIFTAKGTLLCESMSFEPFCVESVGAEPEKSQKVMRGSHGNDVSPLIQGLNSLFSL